MSDITSHVLTVMMGFFSMETHETVKLLVMALAVSSHCGDASDAKDVCRMLVRCRENKTKLWEVITGNGVNRKFGRHFFAFSLFFSNLTVSVLIKQTVVVELENQN